MTDLASRPHEGSEIRRIDHGEDHMSQANPYMKAPREQAPSDVHADNPLALRIVGVASLFPTTLGVAAIIANQYGPRWINEGNEIGRAHV